MSISLGPHLNLSFLPTSFSMHLTSDSNFSGIRDVSAFNTQFKKDDWFLTPHGILSYMVDIAIIFKYSEIFSMAMLIKFILFSMLLPIPRKTVFIYNHYNLDSARF